MGMSTTVVVSLPGEKRIPKHGDENVSGRNLRIISLLLSEKRIPKHGDENLVLFSAMIGSFLSREKRIPKHGDENELQPVESIAFFKVKKGSPNMGTKGRIVRL